MVPQPILLTFAGSTDRPKGSWHSFPKRRWGLLHFRFLRDRSGIIYFSGSCEIKTIFIQRVSRVSFGLIVYIYNKNLESNGALSFI